MALCLANLAFPPWRSTATLSSSTTVTKSWPPDAGDYLAGAIAEGGAAVIVATPGRCAEFEAHLAAGGVDVGAARRDGPLICLDATRVARLLTGAGRIDRAGFDTQFRPAILAAGEAPGPVRIYGEVVALLWAAGQVNAALELEGLLERAGPGDPVLAVLRLPAAVWWKAASIRARSPRSAACTARWSAPRRRRARPAGPPADRTVMAGGPPPAPRRVHWADVTRTFGGTRRRHPGGPGLRARDARPVAW